MIFNSISYLFFLPIVLAIYYLLPVKYRWAWLLSASCYFYMWFVPVYMLILGTTIVIDYFAGILIESTEGKKRKHYLYLSLAANIGVLCVFKYYNFFIDNILNVLSFFNFTNINLSYLSILLPIGLSFHTFQAMSYTLEVYKGKQTAIKHFGVYSLYVMFFPQLVAGPIERPQALFPQFHFNYQLNWPSISSGFRLIILGLFKKIVIADHLNPMVANIFDNPQNAFGISVYLGFVFFILQVYCDFSGYSDMARGSAKLFGIELMENFKQPFFANSLTTFWAKWHISLMNWFRDYIMFPLVKKGHNWQLVFLLVFLLSGFWHGANWTFVLWGAFNGLMVIYTKSTYKLRKDFLDKMGFAKAKPLRSFIQSLCVFHIFAFSGLFFRAKNLDDSFLLIKNLFSNVTETLLGIYYNTNNGRESLLYLGQNAINFYLSILFIIVLFIFDWQIKDQTIDVFFNKLKAPLRYLVYIVFIFIIILMSNVPQTDFVYFQF